MKLLSAEAETIDPKTLRIFLFDFPTIHNKVLELYADRIEGNEERINAILDSMQKNALLSIIGSLDMRILAMAAIRHPEKSLGILRVRSEQDDDIDLCVRCIAKAITKSLRSAKTIENMAWKIAKAYPEHAEAVAEFHPKLRSRIKKQSMTLGIESKQGFS